MSGGGQSSQPATTETTQKTEPWDEQKPYLQNVFSAASDLGGLSEAGLSNDNSLSYFPGSTVVGFSDPTQLAMQMQTDRAINGSPVQNAAEQYTADTLSGKYLEQGNPYFQNMMTQVGQSVTPMVDSKFEASGRYGGGAHRKALADSLTDAGSRLAYQNYGDERQNQTRMAAFAPEIGNIDYQNINALSEVGANIENLAQAQLNEDIERFNYGQMEPYTRLGLVNNFIQGNYGGTGTGTTTGTGYQRSGSNTAGNIIAGIGTAAKIASLFASDRRLKRNIRKIGQLANGLNLYRWVYVWGQPAMGLMADEVKKIKPWAVERHGGYDYVNYAEAL